MNQEYKVHLSQGQKAKLAKVEIKTRKKCFEWK